MIEPLQADAPPTTELSDIRNLSRRVAVGQGWFGALALLVWPLLNLLHPSRYPWHATLHAVSAVGIVVVGGYAGHHAIYLLRGVVSRLPIIQRINSWCVGLAALTVVSGNWAYMPYRGDGGARQRLLASAPFFHNVLMEFKEFICLVPLPLYVSAAFLLWHYRGSRDGRIAAVIGTLVILAWAFLILGAVAGMSIAKVQFL